MGGWVALKFSLGNPERVRRVFVISSAGVYFDFPFELELFQPTNVEQAQQLLTYLTPHAGAIPRFVARDLIREMRPTRWVVDRAMKSMKTGNDLVGGKLRDLQAPLLIVWGREDRLIPLSCGEEMHRELPGSVLAVIDGCGHLAPIERPARVVSEIVNFLGVGPASAEPRGG